MGRDRTGRMNPRKNAHSATEKPGGGLPAFEDARSNFTRNHKEATSVCRNPGFPALGRLVSSRNTRGRPHSPAELTTSATNERFFCATAGRTAALRRSEDRFQEGEEKGGSQLFVS
ncbi:hypothetical protein J6590_026954 [Homalodisca vitripennis]|nr:hypothetical protein J6590_026954 [Homalodisca vitripennis]